jgi:imidazole glycerol-phosphate synthase subunit HisH
MKVVIIKYNAGNIYSVQLALERLGIGPQVTDDPSALQEADKIIFPGVGEARSAMNYLQTRGLDRLILNLKQPVLGICLGLQLMCRHSEENDTAGLGIFRVPVKRFQAGHKVPHMGWNTIHGLQGPLFHGIAEDSYMYFVHSYYAQADPAAMAVTDYIVPFSAALQKNNFFAVQFHPEKSGTVGERILKNFIGL